MGDHPVLFLPGPTEVDEELRRIMAMPIVGHRDPAFQAVVREVCTQLRELWLTRRHAAFETCAATTMMEGAIRNLVPRGGRCLHLVLGAFSARWHEVAGLCGREAEALEVPLGQAHTPELLRRRLEQGPPVAAVTITHNETATGTTEPLPALAAVVHELAPDALVLVDCVSSVGGIELRFDDWRLDFAFAGTQKCLALPPGLCVYAVSDRALDRARATPERGFMLDLPRAVADTNRGVTLATPCVPLVYALRRQLERIATETLPRRWARHLALRDRTLAWVAERGMRPFVAAPAARSPTVTCVDANGHDVPAMAARAAAAGYTIDRGYGPLRDQAFRIGHMGDHPPERLERLLAVL